MTALSLSDALPGGLTACGEPGIGACGVGGMVDLDATGVHDCAGNV